MQGSLGAAVAACLLVALPAQAKAPTVFVNNVRVDGLRNQHFLGADVRFDENGDIRITAKGYRVTPVEVDEYGQPPSEVVMVPVAPPQAVPGRFYISPSFHGPSGWEVDVTINGVLVRRFRPREGEGVVEITRYLRPGPNQFRFSARRDGARLSDSPSDYLELVIGDGEPAAGQIKLNRVITYRRHAGEVGAFASEATLRVPDRAPERAAGQ